MVAEILFFMIIGVLILALFAAWRPSHSRYDGPSLVVDESNENTLTYDELSVIETCEEFHQSGKDIDDPEWRRHQERISGLVECGVYQEQNAYGDWVWHKDKASQKSFWAWLNNGE